MELKVTVRGPQALPEGETVTITRQAGDEGADGSVPVESQRD